MRSANLAADQAALAQQHRIPPQTATARPRPQPQTANKGPAFCPSDDPLGQQYAFIANTLREFATLIDRQYRYVAVNDAYCRAHGKPRAELVGRTLAEIWGEDVFQRIIKSHADQCFAGSEVHYEAWLKFPALGMRCMEVSYYPYRDETGAVTHIAVISHDITSRKQIEDLQTQLSQELQRVNEELHSALRGKDELIQNLSHEFRTPLANIMGYGELLASGGLGPVQEDQVYGLEVIQTQAKALLRMVETLLKLHQFNVDRLDMTTFGLHHLLRPLAAEWQPRIEQARLRLEAQVAEDLPLVRADFVHLREALDQVLDNAVKFTPAGGTISLRTETWPDEVCIAISDTGIGIPPAEAEKVFERFHQVDGSLTRAHNGLGLGLALVRQIVFSHDGRAWVESDGIVGHGTTVCIALPIAREEDALEQEAAHDWTATSSPTPPTPPATTDTSPPPTDS